MLMEDRSQKPAGSKLLKAGLVILGVGIVLLVLNLGTSSVEMVPGTLTTREVPGSPSAGAILLLVAGLALTIGGYAKRLLAAVERR